MTNGEFLGDTAALRARYKGATFVGPAIVHKTFRTVTVEGSISERELCAIGCGSSPASLLPRVPPGFKRVLTETSENPWDRSIAWKVVDEQLAPDESLAPPVVFCVYDPPDPAKMAKIVMTLKGLIRDDIAAMPVVHSDPLEFAYAAVDTAMLGNPAVAFRRSEFMEELQAASKALLDGHWHIEPSDSADPKSVEIAEQVTKMVAEKIGSRPAAAVSEYKPWHDEVDRADWTTALALKRPDDPPPTPSEPTADAEDDGLTWRQRKPLA